MTSAQPSEPRGAEPDSAVICDARGMAEIHRYFKRGFSEAPALVEGVAPGDTEHAGTVADAIALLSGALHRHHEGEDERLWDAIAARAPACALHVERMKVQHAQMLEHLTALDGDLPAWRADPSTESAAAVLDALEGVNQALAVHLPDEEREIVPVIERTLTQKEVEWFAEHGRRGTPRGAMWIALGDISSAQPDPDDWFRRNLPLPVRLMWRASGRRRYAAHRAALTRSGSA